LAGAQLARGRADRVRLDLLHTIDQVLRAGATGSILRRSARVRLDLAQVTRECVELARTRFHLGPDALEYVERAGRAVVLGDVEELKAAVWNLIDNAVKYSQGDVKIRVELVDEPGTHRVAVRVTDNGVGISPAELKRIFRRFYRIPASVAVRTKGSGLGLFIVRSVARKHGGRAFAESEGQGRGSTFTLLLPAAPASA
jgi:two-component system sensor histidine kinase SenX3